MHRRFRFGFGLGLGLQSGLIGWLSAMAEPKPKPKPLLSCVVIPELLRLPSVSLSLRDYLVSLRESWSSLLCTKSGVATRTEPPRLSLSLPV